MPKLQSFFKLLIWFWDHSEAFMQAIVTSLAMNTTCALVASMWNDRASALWDKIHAADNPVNKSAQALRELATLLESMQDL